METIKRQATKLRDQVAKQQQAILRQLGQLGNIDVAADDGELQSYQQLQNLYNSTRAAKHFQRDIVRGVEGFVSTSQKQMEIARRFADDCIKYGNEDHTAGSPLARAAQKFGTSHGSIEDHRETLLVLCTDQVSKPLRASITGAPLEDARHLTHRYERIRYEVESQAAEVIKRRSKCKDPSAESVIKLKYEETKLAELKSSMMAIGKEATDAMLSVENEQQQMTFQKLLAMVDAERSYHQKVVSILEKLHAEMIMVKQHNDTTRQPEMMQRKICATHTSSNGSDTRGDGYQNHTYFIAKVIHPFDAQADGELSLSVDDYVVVRQVALNGWSEGEFQGKAGWFPSAYVERHEEASASKITE